MQRGKFITLEGGEGSGKSTQVKKLVAFLESQGIEALATREVGGSPGAEQIRALWLSAPDGHWDIMTEVLLIMAARREHLVRTVWPALEKGVWVVSDRFVDSTRAYQGVALGLGLEKVDRVYQEIAGDFKPDKTFLLDLPVEVGLSRMTARSGAQDRFEQKNIAFHQTLRDAYQSFAAKEPERFSIIDALQDPSEVSLSLFRAISELDVSITDTLLDMAS